MKGADSRVKGGGLARRRGLRGNVPGEVPPRHHVVEHHPAKEQDAHLIMARAPLTSQQGGRGGRRGARGFPAQLGLLL
eukprot:705753-Prorocentrum_minimum.AAC.1